MSKDAIILIVDDEEDDRLLMQLALKRTGIVHRSITLADGEQAIQYLLGSGIYADRETYPLPKLVVTDFIMPRKGGIELLNWARQNPEFSQLPIITLVGSASPRELRQAEQAGATAAFSKPVEFSRLVEALKEAAGRFFNNSGSQLL